jgi:hypothetical protein
MAFWQPKRQKITQPKAGQQITDAQAFDLLCAMCLSQEQFPGEILSTGNASGWYERIRSIGTSLGWDVTITITDKAK